MMQIFQPLPIKEVASQRALLEIGVALCSYSYFSDSNSSKLSRIKGLRSS